MSDTQHPVTILPAEFEGLLPPPLLLPGESLQQYEALRRGVFLDIAPRSTIEWLLAIDVAELAWEIWRYRSLRHKLLESCRQNAVETALQRLDSAGIPAEHLDFAECQTGQNAWSWRFDASAKVQIEARLAAHGVDQHSLDMQAHVEAREALLMFEHLLNSAQARRLILLREIANHRRRHDVGCSSGGSRLTAYIGDSR